jgi:hypothetical protein
MSTFVTRALVALDTVRKSCGKLCNREIPDTFGNVRLFLARDCFIVKLASLRRDKLDQYESALDLPRRLVYTRCLGN